LVIGVAQEIERKFLVDSIALGPLGTGLWLQQGFIPTTGLEVVRIRLAGERAWLTLKGKNQGATRSEYEYEIPSSDAEQILAEFCGGHVISKTRYHREFGGHLWEIDVFEGDNAGLVIAEVELASEAEPLSLPDWVTEEVTDDARYYNVNLLAHPFRYW
jgi:adenylate cyclase